MLVGLLKPVRIASAFTDFRVVAFSRIVVFMVIVAVLALFLVSTSMLVQS